MHGTAKSSSCGPHCPFVALGRRIWSRPIFCCAGVVIAAYQYRHHNYGIDVDFHFLENVHRHVLCSPLLVIRCFSSRFFPLYFYCGRCRHEWLACVSTFAPLSSRNGLPCSGMQYTSIMSDTLMPATSARRIFWVPSR